MNDSMARFDAAIKSNNADLAKVISREDEFSRAMLTEARAALERGTRLNAKSLDDVVLLLEIDKKILQCALQIQTARIAALADRVAALAEFPMKYVGTYQNREHRKNEVTTFSGSLWICLAANTLARPGDGPDWQMCCKKGVDAR